MTVVCVCSYRFASLETPVKCENILCQGQVRMRVWIASVQEEINSMIEKKAVYPPGTSKAEMAMVK